MRQIILEAVKSPKGVRIWLPTPTKLSAFKALKATIIKADGTHFQTTAYKEFVFWERRPVQHREAFLLPGIELGSIPDRSSIELT